MRITLIKYISKEIWAIFLTCLLVFLFIILATQMLDMAELIVNYGAGFGEFISLILCKIPEFILYAMPVACLMAVLLSFIRMSSDNEIIALHSSGISIYQLMSPVIIFSVVCFLFALFLTLFWTPYGNRTFETVLFNIMKTRIESQIKEGVFMELGDYVIYVNNYSPKDKVMRNVLVVDKSEDKEKTVVAKKAVLTSDGKKVFIRLADYKLISQGERGVTRTLDIGQTEMYEVEIDNLNESESNELEPGGMYLKELLEISNDPKESIKKKNIAELKLYGMFSVPAAIFLIGIAGAPLGAQIRANGRTKGVIISLILFLCYHSIFFLVEVLCKSGIINPAVGVWIPVLFLLVISVFLLLLSGGSISFNNSKRLQFFSNPR